MMFSIEELSIFQAVG